jgi:hypothetical protein
MMNSVPAIAGVILLATVVSSAGQSAPRSTAASTDVPRTPWHVPDLQGRWTNATVTPLQRPPELAGKEFFSGNEAAEYQKHAVQRAIELSGNAEEAKISGEFEPTWMEDRPLVSTGRTSLIVGADGRIPPLTADAQTRGGAAGPPPADHPEERTLNERCLAFPVGGPPMLPGLLYNSNYEIVQTPTYVMIFAEMGSATRIIPLDGRSHLPDTLRLWQGDSRGHWEGNTLVVETTNFSDKRRFRGSGATLHLIERFRRVSPDTIMYEFTVEDAKTWTRPWTVEIPMRPLEAQIYEFACHEGNYGLANILKGARFSDGQPAK